MEEGERRGGRKEADSGRERAREREREGRRKIERERKEEKREIGKLCGERGKVVEEEKKLNNRVEKGKRY